MKNDPRSCDRNFYNCVKKPEKKNSGLQRSLNPWPRDNRCDALPTELGSHWRWEQVNCKSYVKSFDFISAVHIWFISYASFTYISFTNTQLTCSQRQWLHSSVGRASHRYREVTGSSPVEVLNFFQASLRNCKNCDHNCEDHSSCDLISAVHIRFISYASFTCISSIVSMSLRNVT